MRFQEPALSTTRPQRWLTESPRWSCVRSHLRRNMDVRFVNLALIFFLAVGLSPTISAASTQGDLPYIAITEIESTVDSPHWRDYKNSKASNFQTMLETQMTKINRFRIMERNRVDQVLAEQGLQESLSSNDTILSLEGVDYIVYGSVTKFGSATKRLRTGRFSTAMATTTFGVDLKVVHVTTGEIRIAENVEATVITGRSLSTGGFSQRAGPSDPLADVQRVAARKAAALITGSIFPIKVVAIDGEAIYLNFGEAMLEVGDTLNVVREGRAFIDPDTGRSLGATRKKIATIKISETTSEFSIAELLNGKPPQPNDTVVFIGKAGKTDQRTYRGKKI